MNFIDLLMLASLAFPVIIIARGALRRRKMAERAAKKCFAISDPKAVKASRNVH